MRTMLVIGLLLLVLGIISLFVPIPTRERHGFEAGPVSVGVETVQRERVHPAVSGVLLAAGAALMIAGRRKRS